MRVGGIVLCGGQSSRMGRAKEWLPFGPEVLLQRVVRVVQGVVSPLVVVAAPENELPPLPSAIRVMRDTSPFLGPLNGLVTGLGEIEGECDAVYLSACDLPYLTADYIHFVVSQLGEADICLTRLGGFHHPLSAVYRTSVLQTARRLLADHQPKMLGLMQYHRTKVLTETEFGGSIRADSLTNINTPTEYQAALKRFEWGDLGVGDL